MAKDYIIEHYPKFKDEDISTLSAEQLAIRKRAVKYVYKEEKTCNTCGKKQSISEFYFKNTQTGQRANKCRDCSLKAEGVVEVGKYRFSMKILKKGFRRCFRCKTIQPISAFFKNKGSCGEHSNTCKKCSYELLRKYQVQQKQNIGDHYVKQRVLANEGRIISGDEIKIYRKKIIEKRTTPKYHCDGQSFVTLRSFAKYIQLQYNLPISTTEKRISTGHTEEDCKLPESEIRSLAYTKGKIKVIDTVTGKEMIFSNTWDDELRKMFGDSTITRAIKTGKKTRITALSKYKNPCTIQRIINTKS